MDRRALLCGCIAAPLISPLTAKAQQEKSLARIGILRSGSPPDPFVEAFRHGLRELGYAEGRNIAIEYRWAEGHDERRQALAADLVRLKIDVIVAGGTAPVLAARRATNEIPIVMPVIADPVRLGLVASLPRPGGNMTGFASQNDELPGKWMQLLREALPKISRVAVLADPATAGEQVKASEVAARALSMQLQVLTVRPPDEFATAFAEATRSRADALIVLGSPLLSAYRTRLVDLATKHRLPTMYPQREFVVGSGGLMSYGADLHELFRRAATHVDKILKGAKPRDLPIELPTSSSWSST